jgi:DNA-binding transcriptional ArsR family regulator
LLLPIFRSAGQARVLAAIFLSPDGELSVQDVAELSATSYPTAHREVVQLVEAGLLRERRVGQVRLVRPHDESPYFHTLRELLEVAFGPVPLLRAALEPVAGVDAVAIFGSYAERLADQPGPPPADVDVLIVGSPDLGEVYEVCRQVARQVDRPVNPTVFSLEEWQGADPFVRQLREGSLVPVLGAPVLGAQPRLPTIA